MDHQLFADIRSPQRLAALQQSQLLNSAHAAVYQQIVRVVARALAVPVAMLLVLEVDGERIKHSIGLPEHLDDVSLSPELSFSSLLLTHQTLLIEDTHAHPATQIHPTIAQAGLGAVAAVPLYSADKQFLGALVVGDVRVRAWAETTITLLQEFATLIRLESETRHDVTEQEQEMNRLRFQAQLVEHVEQAVVATNAQGIVTYWNPFAEKLYGWPAHDVLGRPIVDIIPMNVSKERMLASIERLANGNHDRAEIELRRRDGTMFPALVAVAPIREQDGSSVGIVGVSTDITDRKRMEAELRERERRYRAISQLTSDYVYAMQVEPDGTIQSLWVTSAFERITGYTRAEAEASGGWQALIHPDDMPSARERGKKILDGHADVRDLRIITKQGELRWIRDYAAPEWDAQHQRIVGIIGAAQDITERKKTEDALREAESRYRTLVERIPAITYITKLSEPHRTLYISPQVEHILGYPVSDWLGDYDFWVERIHPDDRAQMNQVIQHARQQHESFHVDYRMIDRDGRIHWLRDETVLVETEADGSVVLQGIAFEITAQKRAEEDRLAFERTLLESQKRESLGVLAGGVAHDFNNLLLVILGNASLAQLDVPQQSPAYATITEIVEAAERAANLVQQLLAYAGKGRLVVHSLHLGTLVEHMRPLLLSSLPKQVKLDIVVHNDLPLVKADENQIRQVVTNLVLNAAEAIGEQHGQITITVKRLDDQHLSNTTRWSSAVPHNQFVTLTVTDTGYGMDTATQARMFDPFFSTKFTGRGLGLAAVQGIIHVHDGVIGVTSAPGRGTSFIIGLPSLIPHDNAQLTNKSAGGIVLVIDTEESVRTVTRRLLERVGFTVLTTHEPQAGVELFQSNQESIVCVLQDVMQLPPTEAEHVVTKIRASRPDLPIILTGSYGNEDVVKRFATFSRTAFLQKPFSADELRHVLQQLVDT